MLINSPHVRNTRGFYESISESLGRPHSKMIELGIYEIGHFGGKRFMEGYDKYPRLSISPYGVCDYPRQIIEECPEIVDNKERKFVITVHRLGPEHADRGYGFIWSKMGPYIGKKDVKGVNEIDEGYVYHIYEKSDAKEINDPERTSA